MTGTAPIPLRHVLPYWARIVYKWTHLLIPLIWIIYCHPKHKQEGQRLVNLDELIFRLESWDIKIFLFLNGKHNPFFDLIMYLLSDTYSRVSLYLCGLYFIYKKYGFKITGFSVLFIALVIFLCDRLSVVAFKEVFKRYRPCHNRAIFHLVHMLSGYCGGRYGFVSSHAANSFGLALFFGSIFRKECKWLFFLIFLLAFLAAYSRIYFGIHYPGDVIGGAIVGSIIGWGVYKFFRISILKHQLLWSQRAPRCAKEFITWLKIAIILYCLAQF